MWVLLNCESSELHAGPPGQRWFQVRSRRSATWYLCDVLRNRRETTEKRFLQGERQKEIVKQWTVYRLDRRAAKPRDRGSFRIPLQVPEARVGENVQARDGRASRRPCRVHAGAPALRPSGSLNGGGWSLDHRSTNKRRESAPPAAKPPSLTAAYLPCMRAAPHPHQTRASSRTTRATPQDNCMNRKMEVHRIILGRSASAQHHHAPILPQRGTTNRLTGDPSAGVAPTAFSSQTRLENAKNMRVIKTNKSVAGLAGPTWHLPLSIPHRRASASGLILISTPPAP